MSVYKHINGILHIMKEDLPEVEVNILNDVHASYRKFIEKTIYRCCDKLMDEIRDVIPNMANVDIRAEVGRIHRTDYTKTQTKDGDKYYPVSISFLSGGSVIAGPFELVRIPYMNTSGKLNMKGNARVVLNVQRTADEISYNRDAHEFNISMPRANIRISSAKNKYRLHWGKQTFSMEDVIIASLYSTALEYSPAAKSGNVEVPFLGDIFRNQLIVNSFTLNKFTSAKNVYNAFKQNGKTDIFSDGLLSRYNSDQYTLGTARDSLNRALSLERAIGQTLSRPILDYPEGTLVTEEMISELYRAREYKLFVKYHNVPKGYLSAQLQNFPTIPAGFPNGELLRKKLPQYAEYETIPEDVVFKPGEAVLLSEGQPVTSEMVEFLMGWGWHEIKVKAPNSTKIITVTFEREVVGNYTAPLGELLPPDAPLPDGRSYDEWVYYYENPNLEQRDVNHITGHDFLAITSLMAEIDLTGESNILDRDKAFLKKVLMINELFEETFDFTIKAFVKHNKALIREAITGERDTGRVFMKFTKMWYRKMLDDKIIEVASTLNVSAEVAHICHINTITPDGAEVANEQHYLSMPYFGRICPFKTPAGKKLGLVNTKAIGARVKDGLLVVPYRKVLKTATGITIDKRITWLSVKDELHVRVGDILGFERDANGNILNTPVLARVPNPDKSDEPFIIRNINAYELAGGYVSASPEQFLSPTIALMPFACSDDAARLSYGASQIDQTLYLQNSEKPRVMTKMYEKIVSALDSIRFIMPFNGTVTKIDEYSATVTPSKKSLMPETINFINSLDGVDNDTVVVAYAKEGQRIEEGTCIAECFKYPQPFVVRSHYDGVIRDITRDSIVIDLDSNINQNPLFPDFEHDNTRYITIQNGRILGQSVVFLNIHVSVGDRIHKGQILADTCASRDGLYSPTRNPLVAYNCEGYNYEDGICATESACVEYTSISAHSVQQTFYKSKHAYNHRCLINKGFKYCEDGDKIGEVSMSLSNSDRGRRVPVYASSKAHGIPFEINTIETKETSRTFAIHLLSFNKLQPGDKMAGRHGNKGVVSYSYKDSQAPQLMNGMTVRFILNPCGVPSRMNLGQIDDGHLGLAATILGIYINSESYNGASPEDVENMLMLAYQLANTEEIGDRVTKTYNRAAFDRVIKDWGPFLPAETVEEIWSNIDNVIDWRGAFYPDGTARVYDPIDDKYFECPMTIGCPSFNKLVQEADEKINVRGGELSEQYALTTSQPQKGEKSAKGQRMAEMELMALVANGASEFLREVINEKSDNTGLRTNKTLRKLGLEDQLPKVDCYPRATENLLFLLEACGCGMHLDTDICDISPSASNRKMSIDTHKLIRREFPVFKNVENNAVRNEKREEFDEDFD